jgi:AcrR family transcriptional regulator
MPRRGLDRAAVVEAAVAIADREGLEQLTLAAVAAQLGIRVPSLYNHVDGLDGLRRELALRGLQKLESRMTRAAVGKAGGDAVLALADAYRSFAREHPGLYAAGLRAVGEEDKELQAVGAEVVQVVLAALEAFGLGGKDALHAARALRAIVHGFVALEAAGGFGLPLDLDESFRRLVVAYIRGLDTTD